MSRFCFVRERLVVAVSQRFDKNHLAVLCVTEPQWGKAICFISKRNVLYIVAA